MVVSDSVTGNVTLRLRDVLSRVSGVGDVMIFPPSDYSMRIWLDPRKLKSRELTTEVPERPASQYVASEQEAELRASRDDVLAASRSRHNPLLEHQWLRRPVRSLVLTWWLAALHPRR